MTGSNFWTFASTRRGAATLRQALRWGTWVAGIVLTVSTSSATALAKSDVEEQYSTEFTPKERARLVRGKSVKRKFHLEVDEVKYRAGLSYRLVQGTPLDVVRVLRSPQGIAKAIPYGIEATTFEEKDGVAKVRIRQGKPPVVGGYTVRMKWEMNSYRARFWLDPNHDHDVRDMWGWFMAREVSPGVTLICFAVAFDLGGVAEILASKAHRWSLSTADRIAEMVEEQSGRRFADESE